jgi:DNA polymerase I-like protein with 3'-5' exonuclease and polymerase domains
MTKLALIKIFDVIRNTNNIDKVLIPNVIHDEIIVECQEDNSQFWADTVQKCMEEAGSKFCQRVPLKADPYIGKDWTH